MEKFGTDALKFIVTHKTGLRRGILLVGLVYYLRAQRYGLSFHLEKKTNGFKMIFL